MAEENTDAEDGEAEEGASPEAQAKKKKITLGGGVASIVAVGAIAAMMAVPSVDVKPRLLGPFTLPLFGEERFSCNIKVQGFTRFLQMKPEVNYYAYDKTYLTTRTTDELYLPALNSGVFRVATRRNTDEIFGEVDQLTFMEELRAALDPVLFPVHIGSTSLPWDVDGDSGLRPGLSSDRNTFRGHFYDHVLHVDATTMTLKIDDGPEVAFEKGDRDVKVLSVEGASVYVDTAEVDPEFIGEVPLGIQGQILKILPTDLMVQ
jgi:hypothetical protein